mgnify:CR=1 FL=1
MQDKITVLIVEDDPIISADLTYFMKDFGYSPFPALKNAEDTLMMLQNITPDFILMDIGLAGNKDGIETAEIINQKYQIPIIFLTIRLMRIIIIQNKIKSNLNNNKSHLFELFTSTTQSHFILIVDQCSLQAV